MRSKLSTLFIFLLALEVTLAAPAWPAELVGSKTPSDNSVERLEQIRTLAASVADRLEAQEKLVQAKVDQVSAIAQVLEGGRKDVDWWLSALAIFLAVASVLAVAIPVMLQKRQSRSFENELKRVKETFDQLQLFERDTKDQMRQALSDLREAQREIRIHLETAEGAANQTVQLSKEAEKASRTLIADKTPEELGKAANQLRDAKSSTPQTILVSKALEYAESGQWDEAIARWRALIDLEPESESYWFNLGYSLVKAFTGDNASYLEQACNAYAGAVRLKPDMHEALNNWGNAIAKFAETLPVTERPARYTEAIKKFTEALRVKADKPETWANWGLALSKLADISPKEERPAKYAEAAAKYAEALRIEPDMYAVYGNWASVLMHWAQLCNEPERSEKMSNARDLFKKAETSEPGLAAYNLACLAALSGETEDAKKWLEKALVLAAPSVNCQKLSSDTDLDGLRELAWFQEFLTKVCS
jgi:tetratricopeptide (TPR) repeat protein